jgi:hypothetical protein
MKKPDNKIERPKKHRIITEIISTEGPSDIRREISDHNKNITIVRAAKPPKVTQSQDSIDDKHGTHCLICTEEIKYHAIGSCNHSCCHICSLRLRALYKSNSCAYCKVKL